MKQIIEYLNGNSDALMVVITFLYVIATILICVFNAKSASAAKSQAKEAQNQIKEAQRQQAQNAGIQLYTIRKDVLKKYSEKQYDEIFWDIPLLFDNEISDEFCLLCSIQNEYNDIQSRIMEFENHIKEIYESEVYDEFLRLEATAEQDDNYSPLYAFCEEYTYSGQSESGDFFTFDFKLLHEDAIKNSKRLGAKHTSLFLKMQEFVKNSIA